MRRTKYIFVFVIWLFSSCANKDMETSLSSKVDLTQTTDSIAFGDIRFGTDRNIFLGSLAKPPIENKMSEPRFHEKVTEVESPVTVGSITYRGYYYFDCKERLYKIHLQYQNEHRLVRSDQDEAFENLHQHFKTQYGEGTALNPMPGLRAITWNFKNKKIELTSSCLASNCTMECTITETNLFKENSITERISDAKLHLQLKLHPEKF